MGQGISILSAIAALAMCGAAHAAGEEASDAAASGTPAMSSTYLALDMLTATVSRDYRVNGHLQVEAGLEISDPELRARAEALRPRLRDAYAAALAQYAGGVYIPGQIPDAAMIGEMLQDATDRTLGAPGAVLLLGVVMLVR